MSRQHGLQAGRPDTGPARGAGSARGPARPRGAARMRGGRRVVAAALAAVTVVVLTACAAIPTGGAVRVGQTIKDQETSGVDYRPNSPTPGADQDTILRQFIDAATGAQDNYAIAREFLSDTFAQKWNPRQGTTIRQGSADIERAGTRELRYTLTASASVDGDGVYTQAVRPTSSTLTYQFTREKGQWRISYAPDGIILSPASFDLVFQPHALYFYDPTHRYLVPDERWFLARSSVSTRIASALLDGPSDWLKGAVVSAFPEGTQLSLNAVTTDSGTAQVDLSSEALKASAEEKYLMRDQLTASFASVASISSVSLTVEGTSVSVPSSIDTVPVRDPDVGSSPLVVAKGAVGTVPLGGGALTKLPGIADAVASLAPSSLTVSASGTTAAVGNRDGNWIVRSGQRPLRVDARGDLIAPSLDDQNFVWSALRSDPRSITAYGTAGDQHEVASTLPSGRLVSFEVSRDSTRALALIDTSDGAALYVISIVRNAQHQPTAFGPPVRVQAASGDPVGATWATDTEIASVGQTSTGTDVVSSTIGGQSETLSKPDGRATAITGGAGGALLLRLSDGSLVQQTGGGWDSTGISAAVLGTQR